MTLNRRSFLSAIAATTAVSSPAWLTPAADLPTRRAKLAVLRDEPLGTISPLIYGHFAEHIGSLIYGGIWVGPDSKIPNRDGFRLDTLTALQRVRPAVFRWPGGCFADTYHWQDGIGPVANRNAQHNHWWLREEPNTFGTDEFIRWCELLAAAPYLSVNVGSGSVTEALDWLDYCNGAGQAGFAAQRARNGRQKPYQVQWWGIGNENWGCGGLFTAAEYAQRFRQFAVQFKRLGMTPDLQLVGVGHHADDWNRKFLAAVGPGLPYLDHLSIHRYFRRGHSTDFTDTDYVNLMLDLGDFEKLIQDSIGAIEEVEPARASMRTFGGLKPGPIGLIIDEWGVWHSDARLEDGFRQHGVFREALFAASCLNLFHRYVDRVTMTNIAQVTNCLQSLVLTDGPSMILTPTFHVYEMYKPHQGATSVRVDLSDVSTVEDGLRTQPTISASASTSTDTTFLTLVNQSLVEDIELEISFPNARPTAATAALMTADSARSGNTEDAPDLVSPKPWKTRVDGARLVVSLPATSVASIEVGFKGSGR